MLLSLIEVILNTRHSSAQPIISFIHSIILKFLETLIKNIGEKLQSKHNSNLHYIISVVTQNP